jgi:hypothetical protein
MRSNSPSSGLFRTPQRKAAVLLRYVVQFWETHEGLEGANQLTTSESLLTIMSNAATVLEGVTAPSPESIS